MFETASFMFERESFIFEVIFETESFMFDLIDDNFSLDFSDSSLNLDWYSDIKREALVMAFVAVVLQELTADNIDICATFIDDAIDETEELIPFWILFVAESIDDEALSKAVLTLLMLVDNLESDV